MQYIIVSDFESKHIFLALGMYIHALQMKGEVVWWKSKQVGFVPFPTLTWWYKMTGIPGNKCDREKLISDSESERDSGLVTKRDQSKRGGGEPSP